MASFELFLGYDPGGNGAHGVAALMGHGPGCRVAAEVVATVADAARWFRDISERLRVTPTALGVDTITYWELGPGGDRAPDRWLRARYRDMANSVMRPNSLFGAMAIGGVAVARRLRATWPSLQVNETHPKVLYRALADRRPDWAGEAPRMHARMHGWLEERVMTRCPRLARDHGFDAILSAWITAEALSAIDGFTDLVRGCPDGTAPEEPDWPAGPVTYWWPRP